MKMFVFTPSTLIFTLAAILGSSCNPLVSNSEMSIDPSYDPGFQAIVSGNFVFTSSNASKFSYDSSKIDFTSSTAELTSSNQTDSALTNFAGGSTLGVAVDTNGYTSDGIAHTDKPYLKLDTTSSGTNNAELDASWAPRYSHITNYFKFNGSGNISTGDVVPAVVGPNASAANYNASSMPYDPGRLNQGITFDGVSQYLSVPAGTNGFTDVTSEMTVAFWLKGTSVHMNAGSSDTSTTGAAGRIIQDGGNGKIAFRTDTDATNGFNSILTSVRIVNDGFWHHVGTLDSTSAFSPGSTGFCNPVLPLYIGNQHVGTLIWKFSIT